MQALQTENEDLRRRVASLEGEAAASYARKLRIIALEYELRKRGADVDRLGLPVAPAAMITPGNQISNEIERIQTLEQDVKAREGLVRRLSDELEYTKACLAEAVAGNTAGGEGVADAAVSHQMYAKFLTQKGQLIGYLREKRGEFTTKAKYVDWNAVGAPVAAAKAEYAAYAANEKPKRSQALTELERLVDYLTDMGHSGHKSLSDVERLWEDVEAAEEQFASVVTKAEAAKKSQELRKAEFLGRLDEVSEWCLQNKAQLATVTDVGAAAEFARQLDGHMTVMEVEFDGLIDSAEQFLPDPDVDYRLTKLSEVSLSLAVATSDALARSGDDAAGRAGGVTPAQISSFMDSVDSLFSLAADEESRAVVQPVTEQLGELRATLASHGLAGGSSSQAYSLLRRLVLNRLTYRTHANAGASARVTAPSSAALRQELRRQTDGLRAYVRMSTVPHEVAPEAAFQDWTALYTHCENLKGMIANEMAHVTAS